MEQTEVKLDQLRGQIQWLIRQSEHFDYHEQSMMTSCWIKLKDTLIGIHTIQLAGELLERTLEVFHGSILGHLE